MLASKHINKIVAALMSVIVILCFITMIFSEKLIKVYGDTGLTMEYQSKLFNTDEIMNVNIIMDDDKWQEMLDNPMAEEYYQCDVKINGETFYNVGIRPKGNTSLSSIASDETTDRYSFKLEFDQYVDGQTCYGLDKLILNNNYADATNMKEALIYDMYAYLGADASLYNYAKIFVNDEYWGVYTALEAVEDSFLLRNYGVDSGELYKPETMGIGGGDNKDGMDFGNMKAPPDNFSSGNSNPDNEKESTTGENIPQTDKMPNMDTMPEMPDKGEMPDMNGGFSMGGNGANLNYSDDDLDSYSTIWEGEVGNTSKNDHKRVVKALKNISEGTDLETYMDIDNLLKYMAVHVFSVNEDSLSGMMAHNYYLYEENGKLNIIPWDYNLSLGGMGGMGTSSDATDTINDPIDNAFSGTEFFDTLMDNEEYHAKYYEYMQKLVDEYLLGGGFEKFYNRVRSQIDELVETDPNALYTYDEYLVAVDTLCNVVKLRSMSIDGQLNDTIPSTSSEQKNSDALIDASDIDLSVMGAMNMGGGGFGSGASPDNSAPDNFGESDNTKSVAVNYKMNGFSIDNLENFNSQAPPDDMPDGFDPSQIPDDFDPSQFGNRIPDTSESQQSDDKNETTENTFEKSDKSDFQSPPDNMPSFSGNDNASTTSSLKSNLILYGVCFLIMIVALVFAKLYHRRNKKL